MSPAANALSPAQRAERRHAAQLWPSRFLLWINVDGAPPKRPLHQELNVARGEPGCPQVDTNW